MKSNWSLDPNEILAREFDYAAQTAMQANEDRVRVFNYYLVTAGTVIAAVALADTATPGQLAVFALLFGGLAVLGVLFALQLVKLRLAWTESVRAMCQIKGHYAAHAGSPELASAFHWTREDYPRARQEVVGGVPDGADRDAAQRRVRGGCSVRGGPGHGRVVGRLGRHRRCGGVRGAGRGVGAALAGVMD